MSRKVHLVGAWPGRSEAGAIEKALEELAPNLDRLSDGEPGLRSQWITPTVERLRANPDLEKIRDGDYSHYTKTPEYRVLEGHTFSADTFDLGYAAAFENSYPQFKVLRERYGRPDLPFQVGIPSPLDLAGACFGPEAGFGDPKIFAAFSEASLRDVKKIFDQAGDDVVFQIETILPALFIANAPDQKQAAATVANALTEFVGKAPEGTRWGMHLCLGDFNHESVRSIDTVSPWVYLANDIVKTWPEGRTLDYIHAPFAAASEPPPEDEAFYEPLQELEIGDIRLIAGFVHESRDIEFHKMLLERIERLAGREVDVAASCGLGRRLDTNEAWDAMDKAKELVGEPAHATA